MSFMFKVREFIYQAGISKRQAQDSSLWTKKTGAADGDALRISFCKNFAQRWASFKNIR